MFFPRQRIKHIKTGRIYMYLATALDATNARDGNQVAVYSPEDDPHMIYVRDMEEFGQRFEDATIQAPACPLGNSPCRGAACYRFDDCEVRP